MEIDSILSTKEYKKKWRKENKEHLVQYQREWRIKNKDKDIAYRQKNRLRRNQQTRIWNKNNRTTVNTTRRLHLAKYPWLKTYQYIQNRCANNRYYGKAGIKNHLRPADLKLLFFRDKANFMKKPSIDRINPSEDYYFNNCRYIERSENTRRIRYSTINYCPKCGYRSKNIEYR